MDNILTYTFYIGIIILISWVVLSLTLIWTHISLFNQDGSINGWITLWIIISSLIFIYIVVCILFLCTKLCYY